MVIKPHKRENGASRLHVFAPKGVLALFLCAVLALGGCFASPTGQYFYERTHVDQPQQDMPDANMITSYYMLKSAIINLISAAKSTGLLKINNYTGNLETDLKAVSNEITTTYPLGVYAVSSIVFDQTSILSYKELTVSIQYRKTAQEIGDIQTIFNTYDFDRRLSGIFSGFVTHAVFSMTGVSGGDDELANNAMSVWMDDARTAIGLRSITITSYPKNALNRIIEVNVQYLDTSARLKEKADQMGAAVISACKSFTGKTAEEKKQFVKAWLKENAVLNKDATLEEQASGYMDVKLDVLTPYGVFIGGEGTQSAFVMAAKLMCAQLGIEASVETRDESGKMHAWLQLMENGERVAFDPTEGL